MLNGLKIETEIIFENIDILLDSIDEEEFNTIKGGFLVWKHFCHLIHSIDKYFIDPHNYIEPSFYKEKDMHITNLNEDNPMKKMEIINYYNIVKNKIRNYINSLTEENLDEIVYTYNNGNDVSKGDRIIGQIRHTYYHVGYFNCFIKMEKGETPEYLNVERYFQKK